MSLITCLECGHKFNDKTALCDDWNDPQKSFGCPHCRTFYLKDRKPSRRQGLKAGIIGGGIMTPSGMMIGRYFQSGDIMFLVFGVIILASVIGVIVLDDKQPADKLVKSPYSRE
ncbi:hypothetical protein [Rheinheimera sp.]|uniref:hypothetical protein n=1 Tax=Rheinheimera sp. TaxID=1869214 RepID=UPI0040480BAC